jgi:hypothetical protein
MEMRDTHKENKGGPTNTPPCHEWLYSGHERERLPIDALYFHPLVEPEIYHSDTEPGDQSRCSAEAGEPGKDFIGTALDHQVGEECKARGEPDSNIGQVRARCTTEDLWSTTRDSKPV